MIEAALTDTTGTSERHAAFLAALPLAELVTVTTVHLAALNAGVNVRDDDNREDSEDAMDAGLLMDAGLVRLISARPAVTLADLAAKARLARERLAMDACLTAEEQALVLGVLDDVSRLAAAGAAA